MRLFIVLFWYLSVSSTITPYREYNLCKEKPIPALSHGQQTLRREATQAWGAVTPSNKKNGTEDWGVHPND